MFQKKFINKKKTARTHLNRAKSVIEKSHFVVRTDGYLYAFYGQYTPACVRVATPLDHAGRTRAVLSILIATTNPLMIGFFVNK